MKFVVFSFKLLLLTFLYEFCILNSLHAVRVELICDLIGLFLDLKHLFNAVKFLDVHFVASVGTTIEGEKSCIILIWGSIYHLTERRNRRFNLLFPVKADAWVKVVVLFVRHFKWQCMFVWQNYKC